MVGICNQLYYWYWCLSVVLLMVYYVSKEYCILVEIWLTTYSGVVTYKLSHFLIDRLSKTSYCIICVSRTSWPGTYCWEISHRCLRPWEISQYYNPSSSWTNRWRSTCSWMPLRTALPPSFLLWGCLWGRPSFTLKKWTAKVFAALLGLTWVAS